LDLDRRIVEQYDRRRAELKVAPLDETTLASLFALRNEIAAHGVTAPDTPPDSRRMQLLREHLSIGPIVLPEDTAAGLREIADSLQGRMWTLELLATVAARVEALGQHHREAEERTRALRDEIATLERRRDLLRPYVQLLDAFTGGEESPERSGP
jgi:hypothetical protein